MKSSSENIHYCDCKLSTLIIARRKISIEKLMSVDFDVSNSLKISFCNILSLHPAWLAKSRKCAPDDDFGLSLRVSTMSEAEET